MLKVHVNYHVNYDIEVNFKKIRRSTYRSTDSFASEYQWYITNFLAKRFKNAKVTSVISHSQFSDGDYFIELSFEDTSEEAEFILYYL